MQGHKLHWGKYYVNVAFDFIDLSNNNGQEVVLEDKTLDK